MNIREASTESRMLTVDSNETLRLKVSLAAKVRKFTVKIKKSEELSLPKKNFEPSSFV